MNSILISFGIVLGRVGPLGLLTLGVVHVIGYSLNEQILYGRLGIFDAGGGSSIHTFGSYYGMTVSYILSRAVKPKQKPQADYYSRTFAMLGTLTLWMYWPAFNAGYFPLKPYEKSLIIGNTILSLTGSCLGTFIMTSLFN